MRLLIRTLARQLERKRSNTRQVNFQKLILPFEERKINPKHFVIVFCNFFLSPTNEMASLVCATFKTAVDNIIYYAALPSRSISPEQLIIADDQLRIKIECLKSTARKRQSFIYYLKLSFKKFLNVISLIK